MMYKNITTPEKLFAKILERFNTPPNTPNAQQIKIRVGVFLKNWIESPYEELTPEMTAKFVEFIEGPLRNDCPAVVPGLKKAIDSHYKVNILISQPTHHL